MSENKFIRPLPNGLSETFRGVTVGTKDGGVYSHCPIDDPDTLLMNEPPVVSFWQDDKTVMVVPLSEIKYILIHVE